MERSQFGRASLLQTPLGQIQVKKVVGDQGQCSWIGYCRWRNLLLDMKIYRCWHKTDQADINKGDNLPYWQNTTERDRDHHCPIIIPKIVKEKHGNGSC